MKIVDSHLDTLVEKYGPKVDEKVNAALAQSRESNTPGFSCICVRVVG